MDIKKRNDLLARFGSGYMTDAYQLLGCHREEGDTYVFRVWAPNARAVAVVGDFNGWDPTHGGAFHIGGGVWEAILSGVSVFDCYKYHITRKDGSTVLKSDPYGTHTATRPENASKVFPLSGFSWTDGAYRAKVAERNHFSSPINIYELHLGSWRRHPDGNYYSYCELADALVPYLIEMHYTHVELLPVTEHPFDPSWGYQVTGYFAPTSRFGTPHDFMYLVNKCHESGIGVILDFVSAHFPKDECGLYEFDGTCCYEPEDTVMREHPEWGTRIFNYARNEVRAFLISAACYWLTEFHVDGLRVDAVASMLYLDYGREGKEWHPNHEGGNHNLAAIELLRSMNYAAFSVLPSALMIAEESTAFPGVTRPSYAGGLGFNFKWNMGWMNDTLRYMKTDPLFRKHEHGRLTFPFVYAHAENYVLPLSHDEVVHLKASMIGKMPGEYDQKFANLRALYAYMIAFPGKKLSFMGNEIAQFAEWSEAKEIDWFLTEYESHAALRDCVRELNRLYLDTPALYECDTEPKGLILLSADDHDQSVIAFARVAENGDTVVALCNFCPVLRTGYRVGVPKGKQLIPIFSSDDGRFGGADTLLSAPPVEKIPFHGQKTSAAFTLPPMSVTLYALKQVRKRRKS